jgi:hypothetical protein
MMTRTAGMRGEGTKPSSSSLLTTAWLVMGISTFVYSAGSAPQTFSIL